MRMTAGGVGVRWVGCGVRGGEDGRGGAAHLEGGVRQEG